MMPKLSAEEEPPLLSGEGNSTANEDLPRENGTCTIPHSVPAGSWLDWRWQMRNRIRSPSRLASWLGWCRVPEDMEQAIARFPIAITPYYASLIERADASDPIFAMAVPQAAELHDPPYLRDDPLAEDHFMPVPNLVHRYPDRSLLLVTSTCATYCRHCTRKRIAGQRESTLSAKGLQRALEYLKQHPEIHDVIVSGGDPLTLPTNVLEQVLRALREIPSLDIIRIGSRVPVTMPMRVDDELVGMLRKYQPLWLNTHFNHPRELTSEATEALRRLADAGIPLGNQSVLLAGVNDQPQIIEQLCRMLVRNRVRPYYLFQCDLVRGVEHFRTRLSRGIEIMESLRGHLSGLAIPTFVVDAPSGGGKIPVLPNYVVSQSPSHVVLRNFRGMLVSYPEPQDYRPQPVDSASHSGSVCDLLRGSLSVIKPAQVVAVSQSSPVKAS